MVRLPPGSRHARRAPSVELRLRQPRPRPARPRRGTRPTAPPARRHGGVRGHLRRAAKTGTLTLGRPLVTGGVALSDDFTADEVLGLAASVEQGFGGIAALLGAGVLAVIAWIRRAQQCERRPREVIALPEETAPIEQVLDRTSNPTLVELLDRPPRTLAHHHPHALPRVIGAGRCRL